MVKYEVEHLTLLRKLLEWVRFFGVILAGAVGAVTIKAVVMIVEYANGGSL